MQLSYLPAIMNQQHVSHWVVMQSNTASFTVRIILVLSLICGLLAAVQTYTAIYYVMADLLMLGMYTYYKVKNRINQGECFSLFTVFLWVIVSLIESGQHLSSDC